jgi:predicted MFS family arabinose efflux permease
MRGTAVPHSRPRLPLAVWVLGVVAFIMGTSELVVVGLLPELATTFRIPTASAGLLVTIYAIGMMLGAPIMALATLRMPRRTALLAALVVFAASHVVTAFSSSIGLTLTARFIAALANGTFWAVGAVVATDAAGPGSSARALSVMVSGFTLANVVGAPLGTALGQALGWQSPFLLLGALTLGATVLVAKQVSAARPPHVDIRSAVLAETAALKRPSIWLVYAATALVPGGLLATYSYVAPLLLDRARVPAGVVPLALLFYGVGAVAGVVFAGRYGDHRPLTVLVGAVAVQLSVLVAITLWGGNGLVAIALLVLLGAAAMVTNPVLVALVVRAAGGANTLAVALSTSSFNIGIAFGSALGGAALSSAALGLQGPSIVGSALTALALLPLAGFALAGRIGAGGVTTAVRTRPAGGDGDRGPRRGAVATSRPASATSDSGAKADSMAEELKPVGGPSRSMRWTRKPAAVSASTTRRPDRPS